MVICTVKHGPGWLDILRAGRAPGIISMLRNTYLLHKRIELFNHGIPGCFALKLQHHISSPHYNFEQRPALCLLKAAYTGRGGVSMWCIIQTTQDTRSYGVTSVSIAWSESTALLCMR